MAKYNIYKCRYCGNDMELDDCDYNFKGCEDDYFICDCGGSCRVKIRYNRVCREDWERDERR